MHFTVQRRNGDVMPEMHVTLNLPGMHNVLNALAAIAVATARAWCRSVHRCSARQGSPCMIKV